MIKKRTKVSPSHTRRRYFHFLILFQLIFSTSQAVCRPQEAIAQEEQHTEKVYIYGDTKIFVSDDSTISGAEFINKDKDITEVTKTKSIKRTVAEKSKLIKKEVKTKMVSKNPTPPTQFITSKDPTHTLGSNNAIGEHLSISSNTTFKIVAIAEDHIFSSIILPVNIKTIFSYQGYSNKTLLYGHHFQRPPPVVS